MVISSAASIMTAIIKKEVDDPLENDYEYTLRKRLSDEKKILVSREDCRPEDSKQKYSQKRSEDSTTLEIRNFKNPAEKTASEDFDEIKRDKIVRLFDFDMWSISTAKQRVTEHLKRAKINTPAKNRNYILGLLIYIYNNDPCYKRNYLKLKDP